MYAKFEPNIKKNLAILLITQSLCAIFLLVDGVADFLKIPQPLGIKDTDQFEYLVVLVLIGSIFYTILGIRRLLVRNKKIVSQLKAASGAFSELLEEYFVLWKLTNSEKDVALLAIKGLDIIEIADIRDTKSGTIKAQLNAIYRKADVSGRPQLISFFIEELMGETLLN